MAGPVVQMLADNELRKFRDTPGKAKEAVLDHGLWVSTVYRYWPEYLP
jgi:steroid 5-alpha reductase family enzyme